MKITLENVEKTFDTFPAVRGVSLEVESGELVALLGPSGSGKTTILRMVAGLEYADGGRILFGAKDATDIPVRERGVGFVFQHYALFPHMTVAENISFGMKVSRRRRSRQEIDLRVDQLLSLVKLEGLNQRFPSQISGGQRQRVALARALAVDPGVLLLDEPFGALDASVRRDLRRWLRELHDELSITTLFVTHDQEEALDLADRVVILDQGRIVQAGTPREVCRSPNSAFVTRFLGDTNHLPGEIRNGRVYVGDIDIAPAATGEGPAEVFARPSDISWETGGPGVGATAIRVIDRPDGRRILAVTDRGHGIEIDVEPDVAVEAGSRGNLRFTRMNVYPANSARTP
ncbi:sulfate ABC transporter ATP-binding protein [bacterium]|nr:sulfate ABC transporter ATP-binding protein [bacterium]